MGASAGCTLACSSAERFPADPVNGRPGVLLTETLEALKAALTDCYAIERELGRGGMATVYLAHDLRHGRPVALKVLHRELASALGPERFRREIETAARLQHPHILTVYDSGEVAGQVWFVMPFVDGQSLRERLRREKQLSMEEALRITREVALALDYAHRHGVIHRDIKPENILLSDGQALLADFGVARALSCDDRLTATGIVIGTPAYMSPEQSAGERDLDARSDIYALGTVLYEMLAGEPPFTGATAQVITAKRLQGEVPHVRQTRSSVPESVDQAIRKALSLVPADRFRSAAEFAGALAAGHGSEPGIDAVTVRKRASRPKMTSAAFLPLGLLVMAMAVLLLWNRSNRRSEPPAWRPAAPHQVGRSADTGAQLTGQPSLAVLPFVNLSPEPANEYFADGMTEELITALGRVEGLRVAARASSFAFKGKPLDVQDVAQKLKVGSVIDGSVRRAGQRLRITAELVDARNGTRLWAERYDRELRDVFQVQDELARAIVGALRVPLKLTGRSDTALVTVRTADARAHDLYLQGRFLWNQRTYESLRRAAGYFERAIELDSSYAEAYAGLADTYLIFPQTGRLRPRGALLKAKRSAEHALALDSTLAEAHASLGLLHMYSYDWPAAEVEFRRAIALNPSYASAHQWYSSYLGTVGRPDEALHEIQRAQALDPLSSIISGNVGFRLAMIRRYDDALRQLHSTVELDSTFASTYTGLCLVYALKRVPHKATPACERAMALDGPAFTVGLLAYAYATSGNREKAEAIVSELQARSRLEYVSPMAIAIGYVGLGDTGGTFEWLDSAYATREPLLANLVRFPLWDPVRRVPRFARLLARMGLPP